MMLSAEVTRPCRALCAEGYFSPFVWFAFPAVHGGEGFWLLPSRAGVGASAPPGVPGQGLLEARTCGSGGRGLCSAEHRVTGRPGAPHLTGNGLPTLPGRRERHVTGEAESAPVTGGAGRPRRTLRERAQRRALRAAPLEPAPSPRCVVRSAGPKSDNIYEWRSTILGPPGSVYGRACSSSISPSHRSTPSSLRR